MELIFCFGSICFALLTIIVVLITAYIKTDDTKSTKNKFTLSRQKEIK